MNEQAVRLAGVDMLQPDRVPLGEMAQIMYQFERASNAELADALTIVMHRHKLYAVAPLILEVVERLRQSENPTPKEHP